MRSCNSLSLAYGSCLPPSWPETLAGGARRPRTRRNGQGWRSRATRRSGSRHRRGRHPISLRTSRSRREGQYSLTVVACTACEHVATVRKHGCWAPSHVQPASFSPQIRHFSHSGMARPVSRSTEASHAFTRLAGSVAASLRRTRHPSKILHPTPTTRDGSASIRLTAPSSREKQQLVG